MRDWAAGIETRNYGIKRDIDAGMLFEHMRTIVALVLIAGAFLFSSWVRSQIISTGYETQNFLKLEESLLRSQKNLIADEENLKSFDRIDRIARNDLNMVPLHPSQLILPPFRNVRGDANVLALATSQTVSLKKPALTGVPGSNQND